MATAELFIEQADEGDYQSIAGIYNEYILPGTATMEQKPYDFQRVKIWLEGLSGREVMLVLKNATGTVIGWGIIKKYSDREGYSSTCETSVYLTGKETGKGYGTLIKKRLIEECRRLGYHHIVAKIWATNEASIAYNKRLGYEVVGVQKEIGWINGKWIDVVIMQLLLK